MGVHIFRKVLPSVGRCWTIDVAKVFTDIETTTAYTLYGHDVSTYRSGSKSVFNLFRSVQKRPRIWSELFHFSWFSHDTKTFTPSKQLKYHRVHTHIISDSMVQASSILCSPSIPSLPCGTGSNCLCLDCGKACCFGQMSNHCWCNRSHSHPQSVVYYCDIWIDKRDTNTERS